MKKYSVKHSMTSDIDWSEVPKLQINEVFDEPLFPFEAAAQLCWTDSAIVVHMESVEPSILARFEGDYEMPCRDSCLEMFFSPMADDMKYFNFECNPNAATFLGTGHDRYDLERLHPDNIKELLSIRTEIKEKSWSLDFSFPAEFIKAYFPDFELKQGKIMHANFYRCADDGVPVCEMMWNKITNGNTDFHQPQFFGEIELA